MRNAWILCKDCACDASYFAWCDNDKLVLAYAKPANVTPAPVEVSPRGLYEALLELESDPELGDLNDRKIEYRSVFHDSNGAHITIMELRFPDTSLANQDQWELFLKSDQEFRRWIVQDQADSPGRHEDVQSVQPVRLHRSATAMSATTGATIFYASFSIDLISSGKTSPSKTPPCGSSATSPQGTRQPRRI